MLLYHSQAASCVLSDTIASHPFGTISQINHFHYELLLPLRFITVKKKKTETGTGSRGKIVVIKAIEAVAYEASEGHNNFRDCSCGINFNVVDFCLCFKNLPVAKLK